MIKKLIIFIPSIEGGGVEKNLFAISNYLSRYLNNTLLITSEKKFNKKFNDIKLINPRIIIRKFFGRKIKYFLCLIELVKIIIKNKNFVVLSFQANMYCSIVCKVFGIKIITRLNSSPSGWIKSYLKLKIFKQLLRLPNQIIVNSEQFKLELKNKFSAQSNIIYNPLNKKEIINESRKKNNLRFFKKDYINILSIGRLVDQKDHITLLKALNLLKKDLKFKLLIIGDGKERNKLLNFIGRCGLNNNIKILKFQKNPYKFIKICDLFVLTSKYEGLPNVLLEAATLKKSIISSDCPTGPKEILENGKGGLLFGVGDYKDLKNKILFFLHNPTQMNNMRIRAFNSLDKFDYIKNLKKYLLLVKKQLSYK
jgi:glycosyltransferase involved in cell wall biosynthesis